MAIAAALALGVLAQAAAAPAEERVPITQSWIGHWTSIDAPALQRIVDPVGWREFWKRHTRTETRPPEVDFRGQMVLLLPAEVAVGEAVVRPPAADPKGAATAVEVQRTGEALKVSLTLVLKTEGLPPASGPKTRMLLTIVVLPRSSLPVEFRRRTGLEVGAFASAGKLEEEAGAVTLKGILRWSGVEGGAWILEQDRTRYDLHGRVEGVKSGDRVEVYGRVPTGSACIHMVGTIFLVETLHLAK